jgi:hypothetical protein
MYAIVAGNKCHTLYVMASFLGKVSVHRYSFLAPSSDSGFELESETRNLY